MTILEHLIEQLRILKRAEPKSKIDCNINQRKERFEITHLGSIVKVEYFENYEKSKEQSFKYKDNFRAVAIKVLDYFNINRDKIC